jgi:type I restriction enzyme R subunit
MNNVLRDDTELFKQFCDNESFRRWLTDTIFSMTYDAPSPDPLASSNATS